jgi:hypothetical protein
MAPRSDSGKHTPRKHSRSGYAEEQLRPKRKHSKLPGEGGAQEPHNKPQRKPGRGNG